MDVRKLKKATCKKHVISSFYLNVYPFEGSSTKQACSMQIFLAHPFMSLKPLSAQATYQWKKASGRIAWDFGSNVGPPESWQGEFTPQKINDFFLWKGIFLKGILYFHWILHLSSFHRKTSSKYEDLHQFSLESVAWIQPIHGIGHPTNWQSHKGWRQSVSMSSLRMLRIYCECPTI